jgi:hypothetical protein
MPPIFQVEINRFLERLESLRVTVPLMMDFVSNTVQNSQNELDTIIGENEIEIVKKDGKSKYLCKPDIYEKIISIEKALKSAQLSSSFIPTSFLVALVSQYDAYLGRLIRAIYNSKSELLSSSDRQMSFSELSRFSTIDDAKEHIIEKEIESVLRKNHAEQIKWFENKLDIKLTKGLDIWPNFIEITERRNLFVHADGVISHQYIKMCKNHGYKLEDDIEKCVRLNVSLDYFRYACDCVFEMGAKLGHVIWRKLLKEERTFSDENLNLICHNLISSENYNLSIKLLHFATEIIKTHSSEQILLQLKINHAQALKWQGNEQNCRDYLNEIDWSAKSHKFRLAKEILEENYEEAVQIMKSIGKSGEINKAEYKLDPLYKKLRQTDLFKSTYKEIFSEEYDEISESQSSINYPIESNTFTCNYRDYEQIKFDIGSCLESGIRKCYVGNKQYPPLEIFKQESDKFIQEIVILFDKNQKYEINRKILIIISAEVDDISDNILRLHCSCALINNADDAVGSPISHVFYEGSYDEGIIWNKLDEILTKVYDLAKCHKNNSDDSSLQPEWISI